MKNIRTNILLAVALSVTTFGSYEATIKSFNNNIGIGTTSPSQKLEVAGTVSASALLVNGAATATSFSGAGTGLTGTAASLTAGNATNLSGGSVSATTGSFSGNISAPKYTGQVATRVYSTASTAAPSFSADSYEAVSITALATNITSFSVSGTPADFQKLLVRIKDNGTARTITWGSQFESKGVSLPTTTTSSKALTIGFLYDSATSKWGCIAASQEP